ncbi:MAG TPA: DUF1467 family protein [Sphingomonas sp.]|nr:DUF1467 family protein [Sphingomonas sp.]
MRWYSLLAIYFLFWFLSLFVVLPFGVRTAEEAGEKPVMGHADSAPHGFRPWVMVLRTSLVAAVLLAIFYVIYRQGWIDVSVSNSAAALMY